jgi:hypothetical protein
MELIAQKHGQPNAIDVSRIVRIVFALVLVVAVLFKVYEVASNAGSQTALAVPMRLKLALAAFEFLFAVWLLSNIRPTFAHRASIFLVGVMAASSLERLLRGEPDCGCFGTVAVHPCWTFSLDISLLLALCYCTIIKEAGEVKNQIGQVPLVRQYALAVLSPLAIAAVVSSIAWHISSGRLVLPEAMLGSGLVSIDPSPKAIFRSREGDKVTAKFTVRNVTDQPLRLLGANTSCGCTVVEKVFPVELRPGESMTLMIQMQVGQSGDDGKFRQEAHLLVNRDGMVPPLVIEAVVSHL